MLWHHGPSLRRWNYNKFPTTQHAVLFRTLSKSNANTGLYRPTMILHFINYGPKIIIQYIIDFALFYFGKWYNNLPFLKLTTTYINTSNAYKLINFLNYVFLEDLRTMVYLVWDRSFVLGGKFKTLYKIMNRQG